MAADSVTYGIDKDLADKQAAKFDPEQEQKVIEWLEEVSGEKKGDQTLAEWLKNGQVLCATVNKIVPGKIKKVNTSAMPFKQMENITYFMNAARDLGVPESGMFGTPDLYEEKNMNSVISCIEMFGGCVQVTCPEFTGPKLGVPIKVEAKSTKRAGGIATQTGGLTGTLEKEKPKDQKNVGSGAPAAVQEGTANDECVYGIDKDLKEKMDAKLDPAMEAEVVEWIEALTGEKKGDDTTQEWLKDGKVLCAVANAIKPGCIAKVNTQKMPFKQMENITFFMNAAREMGVPESSMFGTPDLYENKNIASVLSCLYTFGGVVQANVPEFTGPKLGVAVNVEAKSKKREGELYVDGNKGFAGKMEVERPTEKLDKICRG